MGLDCSHNCWHGPYSLFMRWRQNVAEAAGLPPLELMDGFWGEPANSPILWARKGLNDEKAFAFLEKRLPIKWECLKPSALHLLLYHSDCDGELRWEDCNAIADELEKLKMPEEWLVDTDQFVAGLRAAAKAKENVNFH